jgi:hypothetical protein
LLSLGLGAAHQLHEELSFGLDAFGIGLGDRRLDRADIIFGRIEAAEFLRIRLPEFVEQARIVARFLQLLVALARFRQRAAVLHFMRVSDGVLEEVPLDQLVDQPGFVGVLRTDRRARGRHLQRLAHSGDARQPLRAARAGKQAELHFRHPKLRRRHRHPVMAGERNLEPAAERRPVDRRHDRLGAILDDVDDLRQHRLLERLGRAELADVGAREEGIPFADDHDRLHRLVGIRFLDRLHQPLANGMAERVYGRVVGGDDKDVVMAAGGDRAHSSSPNSGRGLAIFLAIIGVRDAEAAVDDEGVAVDVAGFVRGKEERGAGDLVGLAAALERVQLADALAALVARHLVDGRGHAGLDQAGADGVHADVEPTSWDAAVSTRLITPALRRE